MVQHALLWLPASIYALGAMLVWSRLLAPWRVLTLVTRSALLAALLLAVWSAVQHVAAGNAYTVAVVVLVLVGFLGWIIGDYSHRYLEGEARQSHYAGAFLFTLAAVCGVIVAEHLLLQIVAWTLSSVSLHGLLTFYNQRPAAVMAARKKFLVSRASELLLLLAALMLWLECGSLHRGDITSQLLAPLTLPSDWVGNVNVSLSDGASVRVTLAAVCLVLAVMLKTAQLPTHGWLIQVMEAPTPVSALLHAGVVNLGGVVLIQWAPLLHSSWLAQTLLVVIGSLTAMIAGVVMLTRITIKVRLAWSTVSQMGLMIMECGLGLYDLALLHLTAHSLYKAHAFLTAGDAVRDGELARQVLHRSPDLSAAHASATAVSPVTAPAVYGVNTALRQVLPSLCIAPLVVVLSLWAWQSVTGSTHLAWVAAVVLMFGLSTLGWYAAQRGWALLRAVLLMAGMTQLYLLWHALLGQGLAGHGLGISNGSAPLALSWWVALSFLVFYLVQAAVFFQLLTERDRSYEWLYAGVHLDEWLSRVTRLIWPARVTDRASSTI